MIHRCISRGLFLKLCVPPSDSETPGNLGGEWRRDPSLIPSGVWKHEPPRHQPQRFFGASYLSQTGPNAALGPAGPSTERPCKGTLHLGNTRDPRKTGKKNTESGQISGEIASAAGGDGMLLAGSLPRGAALPGPATCAGARGSPSLRSGNSLRWRQSRAVDVSVSP